MPFLEGVDGKVQVPDGPVVEHDDEPDLVRRLDLDFLVGVHRIVCIHRCLPFFPTVPVQIPARANPCYRASCISVETGTIS